MERTGKNWLCLMERYGRPRDGPVIAVAGDMGREREGGRRRFVALPGPETGSVTARLS